MIGPTVVKVGGSLLDWAELPGRLASLLSAHARERLVVVAGGGRSTDIVRDLDRVHNLGPQRPHALALRSLDLTAELLAVLLSQLEVAEHPERLTAVWERGQIPVLAPRRFLDEIDCHSGRPLAASWDVTSDSIAARIADQLGARELVLVKSAPLPLGTDRRGAANLGLVDGFFPDAAARLDRVSYVNLRDERAVAVLVE